MKQKMILNLVIVIQMAENTLFIIDCIYSIIYQHYEYVAMGTLCVLMIIFLLFLLGNTKMTIFNNENLIVQNTCINCESVVNDFKCKNCKICMNCIGKFHSNYLNKCLDKNQLQYIFKNISLLILKCLLCMFVRTFAIISYLRDDTNLFIVMNFQYKVFYISLSGGVLLDLTVSIFLIVIHLQLSKEQQKISNFDKKSEDATDIKVQSIILSNGSPKLNKQMKILEFLEKKLSHRNNFVNGRKIYETEPMPIMFEENEENLVQSQISYRKNCSKSEISVNDTSNNNIVPVLQQINSLNSQPIMQVRRPSDINSSLTPFDSPYSTHNMQKSPLCTSVALDGRATPLNLINEESSVNEQSDNKVFESLIKQKPPPNILIREPVHWSQIFTHPGTLKEDDLFNKFGLYLGDNTHKQENIIQDIQVNVKPIIIIIQVVLYFYYLYSFPLLLYGIAYSDYELTYQLHTQLPLLFLNFILFSLNTQKTAQFIDYLPLTTIIPFICALIDINQQIIFMQILHIVTFIKFYQIFKQLLKISICLRIYSIYFFTIRLSQIHFFQIICGFLIVITQINLQQLKLDEFYQNQCSLINILLITNNQSFLIYPIKIMVIIFIIYQFTIISDYINYLYRNQTTLIQGLIELSKIIHQLPFDLKYECLSISNKQILSRLETRNLIDYDKLPNQLSNKLLNAQYSNLLNNIPLLEQCLSQSSISNILMNATKERILEPNEILIEAKQQNKCLYFILSGKVKCYQQRENTQFSISINENGIYNQQDFFLGQQSEFGVQCITCCKILEINSEQFWKEVKKSITELEKIKMCLDRVQFNQEFQLIALSCQICKGNHLINNCKKVHYVPSRQILMDFIYFDEINKRLKFQRNNHTRKFRCMKNTNMIEQIVCNVRHLMLISSETFKPPKTITSLGMQSEQQHTEHSDEDEHNKMSQYVQNLSPVQYVPQVGSSASSYVLKEVKQAQQLKSPKDSVMVHQKRYQEKRQSHVTKIEKDLSPSIIKYATIQDKKSQKSRSIISEDHGNGILPGSDHRQFSKYGIQSSKFTNETAKQFLSNPFDMPLYDLNQSIDKNHSYSEYYPRNNIDLAILSYKQYQDSIISNKSNQKT
ncbi:unnamed protein product [Paramecium pentaurelia]|uniref:Cyclic nucleotide-binding domain-containing protein n=1 Tax=Paramecium pentaurelia TaxID=43138 RepID=A0A8S1X595_9CILI|nr:unnamed protein product [Paramecium pentaurelia]